MWRSDSERIAELERAVETLTKRVAALEGKSPAFPTEKPKDMPSTIFQAKKSDGTLYIDYTFFPKLGADEGRLSISKDTFEQELKNAGFKIVNSKQIANEIAVVLYFSGARYFAHGKELLLYVQQIPNAFIIGLFQGTKKEMPTGVDVFINAKFEIPTYYFQILKGNEFFGFDRDKAPRPRKTNINSVICSTCLSSATGSNRCNVCQETFCGMECFAYGHKDCYQ